MTATERASRSPAGEPDRLRPHAAQGGRPLHPRPGQLRRRHRAARHAARRDPAQPARARPHRLDRHLGRRGASRGPGGHHRRDAGTSASWPGCRRCPQDAQAVLATDKVRFQGQEVAFVVAEDRYSARDALELIDVEYEPLPAVIDATRALDPGRPGDPRRHGRARRTTTSSTGRRATRRRPTRSSPRPTWSSPRTCCTRGRTRRRWRPAARSPTWTRSPASSRSGAPPRRRTRTAPLYALVAGLPEHKIRIISPDIGGGFGNKVRIYPGYVLRDRRLDRHRQAGQVGGGPLART